MVASSRSSSRKSSQDSHSKGDRSPYRKLKSDGSRKHTSHPAQGKSRLTPPRVNLSGVYHVMEDYYHDRTRDVDKELESRQLSSQELSKYWEGKFLAALDSLQSSGCSYNPQTGSTDDEIPRRGELRQKAREAQNAYTKWQEIKAMTEDYQRTLEQTFDPQRQEIVSEHQNLVVAQTNHERIQFLFRKVQSAAKIAGATSIFIRKWKRLVSKARRPA